MTLGGLTLRVASESAAARAALDDGRWSIGDLESREGLLLGQPAAAEGTVGAAAWVLYESGDIVLRRSRDETDTIVAMQYHLASVEHAATSAYQAMRLRAVVLADGAVVLVAPAAMADLAGHDRRLGRKGATVLPTVMASIDASRGTVHLPEQPFDAAVPSGEFPVRTILLRATPEPSLGRASTALALARAVLRTPTFDVQATSNRLAALTELDVVQLLADDEIKQRVDELAESSRS